MKKSFKVPGQETIEIPVYNGNESVGGKVDIIVPPGKKYDHQGIKIEMIGLIGKRSPSRTISHTDFSKYSSLHASLR